LVSVDGFVSGGLLGKAFGTGAGFGETVAFVFVNVVDTADSAGAVCFLSSWVLAAGAVTDAAGLATVLPFVLTGVAGLGVTPSFAVAEITGLTTVPVPTVVALFLGAALPDISVAAGLAASAAVVPGAGTAGLSGTEGSR
jgi:hypothetical protein